MREAGQYLAVLAVCFAAGLLPASGEIPAGESATDWTLVWSDEFDGTGIDRTKWDFDIGNGFYAYEANQWIAGWGNSELQYYTGEPENAFVKDGLLHIRAAKESLHGCGYTSARLKTRKRDGTALFNRAYGKFAIRAQLPAGKGLWPAIWMLPQDETYGTWAASGEIDIMEARGHDVNRVLGTLHFGARWPANTPVSKEYVFPDKQSITDFHVYAVEWEPGEMRWYVDGNRYATQSFWWSSSRTDGTRGVNPTTESDLNPWPAPFDQPFYLLINLAVGGRFPGNPDPTTVFPADLVVDYVRVYKNAAGQGPLPKRGEGALPFRTGE